MDAGTFEPQVAWLAPAHHPNPFAMVKEVTFKDAEPNVNTDEEHGDDSQAADTQMAAAGGDPDVEQAPDAQGQVSTRQTRVARARSSGDTAGEARIFSTVIWGSSQSACGDSHLQPQHRRAGRAAFDYADFIGTKRTPPFIRNSTIYL